MPYYKPWLVFLSFSMGVSHPYSTVGIKLASHIGKSVNKYSAGMGLEYLTARRQTKTFQVNGIINKLRKTAKFEVSVKLGIANLYCKHFFCILIAQCKTMPHS